MALVLADRVRETTTTTGTGTVSLAGPVSGFQGFSTAIGNANTTYYTIADAATGAWEVGLGTYTSSGSTLARTTILSSSNAGAAVNFAAGTKDVFVTQPAERALYLNGAGTGVDAGAAAFTANGVVYASSASALATGSALTFDGTNLGLGGAATNYAGYKTFGILGGASGAVIDLSTSGGLTAGGSLFASTPTITYIDAYGPASGAAADLLFRIGTYGAVAEKLRLTATSLYTASDVNVGFGTSSPSSYPVAPNLVVAASSGGGVTVRSSTYGGVYFADGTTGNEQYRGYVQYNHNFSSLTDAMIFGTSGESRMTIDSSGNLGLGVTPSAWNSSYKAIQVNSQASVSATSTAVYLSNNFYQDAGGTNRYIATGVGGIAGWEANVFRWYQAASGSAGDTQATTNSMTLDASGNWILGNTTASSFGTVRAYIEGAVDVLAAKGTGGASFSPINAWNTATSGTIKLATFFVGAGTTVGSLTTDATSFSVTANAGPLLLGSNNTSKATLDNAGNLGLGVTPSAWATLKAIEIAGIGNTVSGNGTSALFLSNNAYFNSGWKYANSSAGASQINISSGGMAFNISTSAQVAGTDPAFSQAMTLLANGNLLVGTTTDEGERTRFESSSAAQLALVYPAVGKFSFKVDSGRNLSILDGSTERARITSGGDLLVNRTSVLTNSKVSVDGSLGLNGASGEGVLRLYTAGTQYGGIASAAWAFGGGASTTDLTIYASNNLIFAAGAAERARLNTTGAFVFAGGTTTADGIGITFPATQSASSNANTLDDYEEGTWTPTLVASGATFTYTASTGGTYVKIGRLVFLSGVVALASKSGGAGSSMGVGGLPFNAGAADVNGAGQGLVFTAGIGGYTSPAGYDTPSSAVCTPNTATVFPLLTTTLGGASSTVLNIDSLSGTGYMQFSMTYYANS